MSSLLMMFFIVLPGPVVMPAVSDIQAEDVVVTWSPPSSDGGSPITHYLVEQRLVSLFGNSLTQDGTSWMNVGSSTSDSLMNHVASLDPYTGYRFRVIPVNVAGNGMPSLPSMVAITLEAGRVCEVIYIPVC